MTQELLLLGAGGQLGRKLREALATLGHVHAVTRADLDLSRFEDVVRMIRTRRPAVLVNAAAYTYVDRAESEVDSAFALNAELPRQIARTLNEYGGLMVHYSTDYIFSGEKQTAYVEADPAHPLNVYGASKLAGERAILEETANFLILRTSWVYSESGQNFVRKVSSSVLAGRPMRIVSDVRGVPTDAGLLADVTARILMKTAHGARGTYHLTPTGSCSWYEYALRVVSLGARFGMWSASATDLISHCMSAELALPAHRPRNSLLDCTLLQRTFDIELPIWDSLLEQFMNKYWRCFQ